MTKPIIECQGLTHIYKNTVVAVDNLNLKVLPGEVVGIIGQNGSGKTTLVKHFNGLLKPTKGKVLIDGRDTTTMKIQELAKTVGYVFQNPNQQLFAKTVESELEFGPRNIGCSEEEVIERREHAIEFFGLENIRLSHPYRIGFPLRKLVGMASIYTMKPKIYIVDEPTTGQDHITTKRVNNLINKLRDEGATIICVAHDMILLADIAQRMIVMKDSKIILDGKMKEVFLNFETIKSTHITPPQVTEVSRVLLQNKKIGKDDLCLTIPEMTTLLKKKIK